MPGQRRTDSSRSGRGALAAGWLLLVPLLTALVLAPAVPGVAAESRPSGTPAMLEPQTSAVLVDYYDGFLRDQDIERFRRRAASRYTEGTLVRVLASGTPQARRAAVLALGLLGTYDASNAAVARALRDTDPTVRLLAKSALWSIWFRADSPENNAALETVRDLTNEERFERAIDSATKLIARAPTFAEAYNQRAIAYFMMGRFAESAADCQKVLQLNPHHFGALGGLSQCQVRMSQRQEAIKTLKRALKLEPFGEGLRESIAALEALGD